MVHLCDANGNIKEKHVGYSIWFLFFGPFYLLAKLRIISSLILFILYYYLLPLPGMYYLANFISQPFSPSTRDIIIRFLTFFRLDYPRYSGIILVILIQIVLAYFIEGQILRRQIKHRKILPVTENDARILISVHACNHKIPLADEYFNRNSKNKNFKLKEIDVPYILSQPDDSKIRQLKSAEMHQKLYDLEKNYKLGLIKREEYELQRARIKKQYK